MERMHLLLSEMGDFLVDLKGCDCYNINMNNKVYVRPRFRKLKPNEYLVFRNSLKEARLINEHGEFVFLREPEVYQQSQNFLLGDGIAGFAVKDNELISAHKNNQKAKETEVRHILPKMVRCAFKNGAVFGDCYGEFLADYYMKSGFIVACKINFDADGEFVPPTWNYEKHGRPDVYLMMRGVKNVAELDRLKTKKLVHSFDLVEEFVPRFKTYDEAAQFRRDLYNSVKAYGYKNRALMVREYLKNYKNSSR